MITPRQKRDTLIALGLPQLPREGVERADDASIDELFETYVTQKRTDASVRRDHVHRTMSGELKGRAS